MAIDKKYSALEAATKSNPYLNMQADLRMQRQRAKNEADTQLKQETEKLIEKLKQETEKEIENLKQELKQEIEKLKQ